MITISGFIEINELIQVRKIYKQKFSSEGSNHCNPSFTHLDTINSSPEKTGNRGVPHGQSVLEKEICSPQKVLQKWPTRWKIKIASRGTL